MANFIHKFFSPQNRICQLTPAGLLLLCTLYGEAAKLSLIDALTDPGSGSAVSNPALLALKHDLAIFACCAALFILSAAMRKFIVSALIRSIVAFLIAFWGADILVLKYFTTRLTVGDIYKFYGQWNAIRTFAGQIFPDQKWLLPLMLAAIAGLLVSFILTRVKPFKPVTVSACCLATVVLAFIYLAEEPQSAAFAWALQNIYEINIDRDTATQFSAEYRKAIEASSSVLGNRDTCIPGKRLSPNIVVLLFESLSMYHSQEFSGQPSMAPNFDRIAGENTAYTNFFANGCNTEAGLVSMFTGKHMFPPSFGFAAEKWSTGFNFRGFYNPVDSLPRVFKDRGYRTAFVTTGDLGFLNKGEWLESLGFMYVEGAEHPFYNDWPRLHFDAAPDKALYRRFFQLLPEMQEEAPFMLVIETVSTHQPFHNPYGSDHSEAAVFAMADAALGAFYDSLKAAGFFDKGMLIILGDHRTMTGIGQMEHALYGRSAASRVPLVVAYGDGRRPEKIDSFSQQTDFIPAFEYLIGKQSCTGPLNGNFFSDPPVEAEYSLFPRCDDRRLIDVYSRDNPPATIRFNGDDTAVIDGDTGADREIINYMVQELLRISRE